MIQVVPKICYKDTAVIGVYKIRGTIYLDEDTGENWTTEKSDTILCTSKNRLYAFLENDGTVLLVNQHNLSALIFENCEDFFLENRIKIVDISDEEMKKSSFKEIARRVYLRYKEVNNND